VSYALVRPTRLDLSSFARAARLHPDAVRRLVALGLLESTPDAAGEPCFAPAQLLAVGRIKRLRAGFGLNYAAVGLVVDLLDRIAELETAMRDRSGQSVEIRTRGGRSWTPTA
jgi:hypothetical protein